MSQRSTGFALQEKKFDDAMKELTQENQQDPYTLFQLFQQAANQNTLPTLNYAFVRLKAKKLKA